MPMSKPENNISKKLSIDAKIINEFLRCKLDYSKFTAESVISTKKLIYIVILKI